jgi:hypothetical protein
VVRGWGGDKVHFSSLFDCCTYFRFVAILSRYNFSSYANVMTSYGEDYVLGMMKVNFADESLVPAEKNTKKKRNILVEYHFQALVLWTQTM